MNLLTKLGIVLATLTLTFLAGLWTGKGQVKVETHIVKEKGEVVTKVVTQIVTVTKTVRPDGTVTETTRTENKEADTKEKTETSDKNKVTTPSASDWGVGGGAVASFGSDLRTVPSVDYYGEVSRRVIGDVWVDLRVDTSRAIGLGVRIEL